ncbi:restriction endonuclease subunit S [Marinobacter sp. AN1]|uniref:restriction endonuclease subunit S n=1 Tax=Marinobacter sp. AN1 TaxID=2886046 RepID=UPI00222FDC56|nr:restriction endonuclease subunit S [Marinobacter sp. AN1]UZD65761.1 restriction endonuclease subunit S [Marinobacter sp. AN1]
MSDTKLPDCWRTERLDQLAKFIDYRGKTPKKKTEGLPLITAKNVRDGYIKKEPREYIAIADYDEWMTRGIPKEGDVVITTEAPMGNVALLDITEKFAIAQRVICLQFFSKAMGRFAHYALRSPDFQKTLKLNSTGTTVSGIKAATLKGLVIPLPPLAEQKAIADKLDTLLAQVENTKARLERIPQILKRFRQSVLAAAVSGRLTEEWRKRNNSQFPYESRQLSEIIHEMRNGLSPKPNEDGRGHPILRISSVRPFSLDQVDIRHLEVSEKDEKRYSLQPNDLLFTRYNGSIEFVGVCARVSQLNHDTLLYPDKLIRVRVDKAQVIPEFLEIFAASFEAREYIYSLVKSTSGQKGISGKDLKLMKVALPTVSEQTEIVRQVAQLFAHADRIEQQVNNALTRVNNLTQSILAKAFRGELTEQWRKDNPELISGENSAEALLERIKAERSAAKPAKKTRERAKS